MKKLIQGLFYIIACCVLSTEISNNNDFCFAQAESAQAGAAQAGRETKDKSGGIAVPSSEKANYSLGQWSDAFRGSHRAVIQVDQGKSNGTFHVYIPWRRRDNDPQNKRLILVDSKTDTIIDNALAVRMDRESVDFVFQAPNVPGTYYLYYLPHTVQPGSGFYQGDYLKPEFNASSEWLTAHDLPRNANSSQTESNKSAKEGKTDSLWRKLPKATLKGIEARGAFESFYPMEVVAKVQERQALLEKYQSDEFLLFPEDRTRPIVMRTDLPLRWIENGPSLRFSGEAQQNEYYAFQTGIWAHKNQLDDIKAVFSDLVSSQGAKIPASAMTCFNLGGVDPRGKAFVKRVDIAKGVIQPLWFGIDIARETVPGIYSGTLTIQAAQQKPRAVELRITVTDKVLEDRGDGEPWRHSRLRWLNSTLGIDDDIVSPYTPLEIKEQTVSCLGRKVTFDRNGLPNQIQGGDNALLSDPINIIVQKSGQKSAMKGESFQWTKKSRGSVCLESKGSFDGALSSLLRFKTNSTIEFDGHLNYNIELTALQTVELDDIALELPFQSEQIPYMMGWGYNGEQRRKSYDGNWGGKVYFDSFWLGGVHAGVQCELRGAKYCGPMVNLYWSLGQLAPPESWFNQGLGGCSLRDNGKTTLVRAFCGKKKIQKGETFSLEFAFLITPVKPLDTAKQFQSRYYHSYNPVETAVKWGANIINIHHANELNLYINYPFLTVDKLSKYVESAHAKNVKVKLYYTVRELTNHVVEWAAIRSLGTEIFGDGKGGGYPWCREHFVDHYTPQWYDRLSADEVSAAIVTSGESRWYNYYIEGLRWLLENVKIDGLYLDDVTYDRGILKRMRKVMERTRPGCMIDLHSNTAFSHQPANQYLEFFPYVDKLWFGESFNYDNRPDYWLTEISGIPFGVMGEMLQNGGNPWRGMVYGMTARLPWTAVIPDIIPMTWRVWDDFGIKDSKMIGYWEKNCPVKTKTPDICITAYVKNDRTLLALASWNKETVACSLDIDWNALNLDPQKTTIQAPLMMIDKKDASGKTSQIGYQKEKTFKIDEPISVEPGKGWLLILQEKN